MSMLQHLNEGVENLQAVLAVFNVLATAVAAPTFMCGSACIGTGCVIAKKGKGTSPNSSVSHVIMIMIHNDI